MIVAQKHSIFLSLVSRMFIYYPVFDTNFLGCQPSGPTSSVFMFKSEMLSVIRADVNVIFSNIISPDEKISAIGRRTDVNFEHCYRYFYFFFVYKAQAKQIKSWVLIKIDAIST